MVEVVDYLFAAPAPQQLFILHYKGEWQRRCHQVQYSNIWIDSTFGQQYAREILMSSLGEAPIRT